MHAHLSKRGSAFVVLLYCVVVVYSYSDVIDKLHTDCRETNGCSTVTNGDQPRSNHQSVNTRCSDQTEMPSACMSSDQTPTVANFSENRSRPKPAEESTDAVGSKESTNTVSDNTITPSKPTLRPLPVWCYDPHGSSCDWYRDCLELEHPCISSNFDYAIEFGEKYCRRFEDIHERFSVVGRRWLDAVRKCLQVALADAVLESTSMSCEEIRRVAFATHLSCYLNTTRDGDEGLSVCDISLTDWIFLTWTLRGTFIDSNTATEVIKSALQIFKGCLEKLLDP